MNTSVAGTSGSSGAGFGLAEAGTGLGATAVGLAGLAVALLANIEVSVSTRIATVGVCATPPCPALSAIPQPATTVTRAHSLASGGISGALAVVVAAVVVGLLAIAAGAALHAFTNWTLGFVVLCVATVALLGLTFLTGFSIGLLFLPADALAIAAVTFGAMRLGPRPLRTQA
ncbi:MAG TPA: hypothetical protein VNV65_08275 [Candidatus Solibacter sp.]|jgi:hypothetical protein|nr:hypothetical protein [Candidatus Solibacter sp.]